MTEFALRPDAAGPRSGSDLGFPNPLRNRFGEYRAVHGSPLTEVPPGFAPEFAPGFAPGSATDRERRRRMAAARRLSRPTGPRASGGNPSASEPPAREPLTPGDRAETPEAAR